MGGRGRDYGALPATGLAAEYAETASDESGTCKAKAGKDIQQLRGGFRRYFNALRRHESQPTNHEAGSLSLSGRTSIPMTSVWDHAEVGESAILSSARANTHAKAVVRQCGGFFEMDGSNRRSNAKRRSSFAPRECGKSRCASAHQLVAAYLYKRGRGLEGQRC